MRKVCAALLAFASTASLVVSQTTCSSSLVPWNSSVPSIASGYRMNLVATGLSSPRSIRFDNAGNLLVVETTLQNGSVSAITFADHGGMCLSVANHSVVVSNMGLNHGIELSNDGKTLYASNSESVYSWAYDVTGKSASKQTTIITNMTTDDHTTRTLLLSRMVPSMLLVSRGSTSNLDLEAASLDSGHSQIKAFDINNITGTYEYDTAGLRLGWGLRNSVGVAEHPITGGIYSVENSADQITRDGVDVHENNPGEEMNFHGYLNGTAYGPQGQNYGYPWCFAAWNVSELPDNTNLTVGSQFSIDPTDGQNRTDAYCAAQIPPRLTFQAHMAPLDIMFNNSGTEGWVTFHGSWDRDDPVGYKLSLIPFENGEPVAAPNNNTAVNDVLTNANTAVCPQNCFRPVGIAFDQQGRLFMSSDQSGEIYVIVKDQSANGTTTGSPSATASSSASQPSHTSAATRTYSLMPGALVIALLCLLT